MMDLDWEKASKMSIDEFFETFPNKAKEAGSMTLFRLGNDARNTAVELAPFQTGKLRQSIQITPAGIPNDQVEVGTNLVYARIHDEGGIIPAHTVRPVRARALAFSVGGSVVFAKRANIPAIRINPYRGRGYMTPAFEEAQGNVDEYFFEELFNLI